METECSGERGTILNRMVSKGLTAWYWNEDLKEVSGQGSPVTRKCSAGREAAPKKPCTRRMPRRLNQEQERLHDGSRMAEAKTK